MALAFIEGNSADAGFQPGDHSDQDTIQCAGMTNWALRRARFNHDRLKNEFMQSVLRLVRILEGRVNDDCFVNLFFEALGHKWEALLLEARKLSEDASRKIGIQSWFGEYPLCVLPEAESAWMSELLDQEFRLTERTAQRVTRVTQCLATTNQAVKSLTETYGHRRLNRQKSSLQATGGLLNAATHLYQCCYDLSHALSLLAPENPIAVLAAHEGRRITALQP